MTGAELGPNLWQQAWYPVAFLRDLEQDRPHRFVLLGEPLVLWFESSSQQWRAFADRCPHRLVPLSEGRLSESGELECPYHGWRFNGAGACTTIPQGGEAIPAGARCRSYATATAQDLLFVYSGDSAEADPSRLPLVPLLEEPGWLVQDTFRDLPYDAVTLMENVLDVSHVPFTHHGTVGKRSNAGPVELELLEEGPEGFTGIWQEGPRQGKLGTQHTRFIAPGLMWHDLTAKGFARILTVVYATPMQPGYCRLFARFPFQFEQPLAARLLGLRPQWLQHLGNHRVLEDDQIFLHHQERELERSGGSGEYIRACVMPTAADRYVVALRRWINRFGGEPFPNAALPPLLDDTTLLERYESHTRHCRSCRTALSRIEWFQGNAPLLLGGVTVLMVLVPGLAFKIGAGLVLVALLLLLRQCKRWHLALHQGERHPPRNA